MKDLTYNASKTASEFHQSSLFVRALMGPFGSGKTVACIMELIRRSYEQKPNKEGARLTKWVLVRNTYRELVDTTIHTFFEWVPIELGHWVKIDLTFTMKVALPDGTTVHAIFLFRALDRPDDIKKLLSLNITGAFINEAREIPKEVFEAVQGRCGRFPSRKDGGPSWHGLILDTNPPDTDHWWHTLFEEEAPVNHVLFKQPSGLSKEAENIENLVPLYYENLCAGKDQEWINVYIHGRYGFVKDGKPVFPEFNLDLHSAPSLYREDVVTLKLPVGAKLYVGVDFGLTPAAVIGYKNAFGQLLLIDELVADNMGAKAFSKLLHQRLNTSPLKGHQVEGYGDPAGVQRSQTDEKTPFMVMSEEGLDFWPAHTNDFMIRREVVAAALTTLASNGKPVIQVGPRCKSLLRALGGGYKYKRLAVTGESRYHDVPDKNKYSHVADALQYLCLGALGDSSVIGGFKNKKLDYSKINRAIV